MAHCIQTAVGLARSKYSTNNFALFLHHQTTPPTYPTFQSSLDGITRLLKGLSGLWTRWASKFISIKNVTDMTSVLLLENIFWPSIQTWTLPDDWTEANVAPVFNKSADANDIPRYKLKSIMASQSKVENWVKGRKPHNAQGCVCAIWKQYSKRFPRYRPGNELIVHHQLESIISTQNQR